MYNFDLKYTPPDFGLPLLADSPDANFGGRARGWAGSYYVLFFDQLSHLHQARAVAAG